MEASENEVVEVEGVEEATQTERDTYYEFKMAVRVANWARSISVAALVVGFLKAFILAFLNLRAVDTSTPGTTEFIVQVIIEAGYWLTLGAIFFVLLQAAAQVIFFLMDIEENSRK